MCISTRLLLQAILGVNLSKIFRGLRPRTPPALARALRARARDGRCDGLASLAERSVRYAHPAR